MSSKTAFPASVPRQVPGDTDILNTRVDQVLHEHHVMKQVHFQVHHIRIGASRPKPGGSGHRLSSHPERDRSMGRRYRSR